MLGRRPLLLSAAFAVLVGLAVLFLLPSSQTQLLRQAQSLLSTNPAEAQQLAESALKNQPDSPEWLDLAATAAERRRDHAATIRYLQHLHTLSPLPHDRLLKLARLQQTSADLLSAENNLRDILSQNSRFEPAVRQLANLLLVEGRRYESQTLLKQLVQRRSFLLDELAMLGSREELLSDEALITAALKTSSRPLAIMAQASSALFLGKPRETLNLLEHVPLPAVGEAEFAAVKARAHMEAGDLSGLAHWASQHSQLLQTHPDGALCLGWLAWRQGHPDTARTHLLEAIRLDPNHRAALQLLGTILAAAGHPDSAAPLLDRSRSLHNLEQMLHRVLVDDQTASHMLRIASAMEQMGRLLEAWAWQMAIAGYHPEVAAAAKRHAAELEDRLRDESEFSGFQLPLEQLVSLSLPKQIPPPPLSPDNVRPDGDAPLNAPEPQFEDIGPQLGLNTPWFFGQSTTEPRGLSVLQGFGGGVAIVDFDGDLWPDLCVAQGNSLPLQPDPRSCDLLLRNLRGTAAALANAALPADFDYGQGIAAGDFNEDGFTDLLVASTSGTRLLQNNGDGCFTDVSQTALPPSAGWVTSCAIADATGDGIADLFEVRYADGPEPQTKLCASGPERLLRSCRPDLFPGAADRLLIGDGFGAFAVADSTILPPDDGRGLGILVGDFDETGRNSLFISNDMTPNTLRLPEPNSGGGSGALALVDAAPLRGCAVNGAGRIQAGMGIAWGDLTGDGLCDFLVTNFLAETNTLFAGAGGGFFQDLSSTTGADSGSLDLLSFGAQAIDANLDGLQDLFVLNGHVDDYRHFNLPWKMPPAAWIAKGPGHFERSSQTVFGQRGATPAIGRALAQLDWNRDGLPDLAATFIDRPPALYVNQTQTISRPLRIRTVGYTSCRRPIGAVLTLEPQPGSIPRQRAWVTAGDGYYCSCEQSATFALPADPGNTDLRITWPSGTRQEFTGIQGPVPEETCEFLLIEGRRMLYHLPN
jgi:tetratricopeptide (TPR) repeat protein